MACHFDVIDRTDTDMFCTHPRCTELPTRLHAVICGFELHICVLHSTPVTCAPTAPYTTVMSCSTLYKYYDLLHITFFFNSYTVYRVGVLRKTEIFRCHVYGSQWGRLDDKEEASFRDKEKAIVQSLEIGMRFML